MTNETTDRGRVLAYLKRSNASAVVIGDALNIPTASVRRLVGELRRNGYNIRNENYTYYLIS